MSEKMEKVGDFKDGTIHYNAGAGYLLFTNGPEPKPDEVTNVIQYAFGYPGQPGFLLGVEMGLYFSRKGIPVAMSIPKGTNFNVFTAYMHDQRGKKDNDDSTPLDEPADRGEPIGLPSSFLPYLLIIPL